MKAKSSLTMFRTRERSTGKGFEQNTQTSEAKGSSSERKEGGDIEEGMEREVGPRQDTRLIRFLLIFVIFLLDGPVSLISGDQSPSQICKPEQAGRDSRSLGGLLACWLLRRSRSGTTFFVGAHLIGSTDLVLLSLLVVRLKTRITMVFSAQDLQRGMEWKNSLNPPPSERR